MVTGLGLLLGGTVSIIAAVATQDVGSIRGVVRDRDFDAPLAGATVTIVETGQKTISTEQGNFVFSQVKPGRYTLTFSREGYVQQVKADVTVTASQLTDVDMSLPGEFTEMEEVVVEDIQIGGSEAALLKLRMDSPALIDSISADLMNQAGASDAASALNLVAGASVQDGKYAVIRGLPDRYVNSQINGIRLPTADEDKRAVQLDQFPATVIDSIQVSKTFTPDQQGDASGGAVNVMLKAIPEQSIFTLKGQVGYNSQVTGNDNFLTYKGGGVSFWGQDDGGRDQQLESLGQNWTGAAGVTTGRAPPDYKWSGAIGGKHEFDNGVKVGGFASFFYEQESAFFDNGIDDSYWVTSPGNGLTPETTQGTPSDGDFKTKLFDVTEGTTSVNWGGLGVAGIESKHHALNLTYLYTSATDDTATLAEDTRGKEYYFPGYDPNDPTGPGNAPTELTAAPYIRTETLTYTERTTQTIMLNGKHEFEIGDFGLGDALQFKAPVIDWLVASTTADLNQPDKRQFGELWYAPSFNPGIPGVIPPSTSPGIHLPFKPAANFTLGNFQRIWKTIDEESQQYALNAKLPFEQWNGEEGYLKFGLFDDHTTRNFNQDTFSNFNDPTTGYIGDWDDHWSSHFPNEDHAISDGPPFVDVDYKGDQKIGAWYAMADLPVTTFLNVIGGVRFESTQLSIVNIPEPNATWFPPGATAPVQLNPGDADVDYNQDNVLPSLGIVLTPTENITFRAAYSQTVARQTFKELTPVIQQEFLGGPIFIGNPDLVMSDLTNYDVRVDYTPYAGGLLSASWFYKDVVDPIEYVQRISSSFTYTTPVNYPTGTLQGFELEARQDMGQIWDRLEGLTLGANATFINSEVRLPDDEIAAFDSPAIQAPLSSRPMTGAPNYLYNIYMTYDFERSGTQFGIFYTVTGDTLIAGAGVSDGNFVPSVFATPYNSLNVTVSQKLGKHFVLQFQAKNLTNPDIQTVYRSKYIGGDVLNTSYSNGIDLSVSLRAQFEF